MRITQDFVAVRVPATSANLGPGFDSFGLALDLWDEVSVHATAGATHVTIEGEGAGVLDEGENHLVVQALRMGLDAAGVAQVGIQMRCMNRILILEASVPPPRQSSLVLGLLVRLLEIPRRLPRRISFRLRPRWKVIRITLPQPSLAE